MPSLRHCSVGPPRRAIHGPARLSRHPCRDAHCAMPAFGQRGLTGRPRSKSKAKQSKAKQSKAKQSKAKQSKAKQSKSGGMSSIYGAAPPLSRASSLPHWIFSSHKTHVHRRPTVGVGLLAKRPAHPTSSSTVISPSRASPLPEEKRGPPRTRSAIRPPRLAFDLDLGRPVNHDG